MINRENNKLYRRLTFQYVFQFFVVILCILACSYFIYEHISMKKSIDSIYNETTEFINSFDNEETIEKSEKDYNIANLLQNPETVNDLLLLVNEQYDSFISNWTLILTVFTAAIGGIVIIIPLFNYLFQQKEILKSHQNNMNAMFHDKETELNQLIQSAEKKYKLQLEEIYKLTQFQKDVIQGKDVEIQDYSFNSEHNTSFAYAQKGHSLFDKEMYYEALQSFRKASELEPNNAMYYSNISKTYIELSKIKNKDDNLGKADINIAKALNIDKYNPLFYITLANLYRELGDEYKDDEIKAENTARILKEKNIVFVIKKSKDDKFRFNIKSGNGEILFTSKAYNSKTACKKAIRDYHIDLKN